MDVLDRRPTRRSFHPVPGSAASSTHSRRLAISDELDAGAAQLYGCLVHVLDDEAGHDLVTGELVR